MLHAPGTPKDEKEFDNTYMRSLENDDGNGKGCVDDRRKCSEKPNESSTATSTFSKEIPGCMDEGRSKNEGKREASH